MVMALDAIPETSTILISGFADDATDRELEGLVRFMPGFVAAKLDLSKGRPKMFARFCDHEHAVKASEVMDKMPMDIYTPHATLIANLARSDLDPEKVRPRVGATPLHQLGLGKGAGGSPAMGGKGMTPAGLGANGANVKGGKVGLGEKRPFAAASFANAGDLAPVFGKKTKTLNADAGADTLVIFKATTLSQSVDDIHGLFCGAEGYEGLRQGGNNIFLKFAAAANAEAAIQEAAGVGLQCFAAKSNMDLSKATHLKDA